MAYIMRPVSLLVLLAANLICGCSQQVETPDSFGRSVFTAITDQDKPAILKHKLEISDVLVIGVAIESRANAVALIKGITRGVRDEAAFLQEFDNLGGGGWPNVMHEWGMIECQYDSLQLNEKEAFSERVQRYRDLQIFFTVTDTLGIRSTRQFVIYEAWMIDGTLKILDF